jgi:hypothetical protein
MVCQPLARCFPILLRVKAIKLEALRDFYGYELFNRAADGERTQDGELMLGTCESLRGGRAGTHGAGCLLRFPGKGDEIGDSLSSRKQLRLGECGMICQGLFQLAGLDKQSAHPIRPGMLILVAGRGTDDRV